MPIRIRRAITAGRANRLRIHPGSKNAVWGYCTLAIIKKASMVLELPRLLCSILCWARPLPKLILKASLVLDVPSRLCSVLC